MATLRRAARRRSLATSGLTIAVVVLVCDQVLKWWIVHVVMNPPRVIPLTPWLNVVMVWNEGVSFGMFGRGGGATPWVLVAISLVIVAGLGVWLTRATRPLAAVALGGVIGGALGNVVDRARIGAVADFVDVHWASWHWPAFNLADSAIVVGVGLLVLDAFLGGED